MGNQQLINRLRLLIASAEVIQQEGNRLLKELEPSPTQKTGGLSDAKKAKILAKYNKGLKQSA